METQSGIIKVPGIPLVVAGFNWSVGVLMEKFIKALGDKKLLAAKCPNCGYTYAPPRRRCCKCNSKIGEEDMVELSGEGTLESYTVAHVELDGKGNIVDLEKPKIIGAVKPDGADSTLFVPLEDVKVKEIEQGMKVKIKWSAETSGSIRDIAGFSTA